MHLNSNIFSSWFTNQTVPFRSQIKDNPELLKRTLHKKEVKKHKSKVGWKDRTQKQEEKQEFRLKKRQDNINKKISDKKKHKMKRLSKKGRVIPGF